MHAHHLAHPHDASPHPLHPFNKLTNAMIDEKMNQVHSAELGLEAHSPSCAYLNAIHAAKNATMIRRISEINFPMLFL